MDLPLDGRVERTFRDVVIGRVGTHVSLEDVAKFRYACYRGSDMIEPNPTEMMTDAGDHAENSYLFSVQLGGSLVGTLRIHHVAGFEDFSETRKEYSKVIDPLLRTGNSYVEPARLAVDPSVRAERPEMKYVLMLMLYSHAALVGARYMLFGVRREHVLYYRRIWGFKQIFVAKEYEGIKQRVALMGIDYEEDRERVKEKLPFLKLEAEARQMIMSEFPDVLTRTAVRPAAVEAV